MLPNNNINLPGRSIPELQLLKESTEHSITLYESLEAAHLVVLESPKKLSAEEVRTIFEDHVDSFTNLANAKRNLEAIQLAIKRLEDHSDAPNNNTLTAETLAGLHANDHIPDDAGASNDLSSTTLTAGTLTDDDASNAGSEASEWMTIGLTADQVAHVNKEYKFISAMAKQLDGYGEVFVRECYLPGVPEMLLQTAIEFYRPDTQNRITDIAYYDDPAHRLRVPALDSPASQLSATWLVTMVLYDAEKLWHWYSKRLSPPDDLAAYMQVGRDLADKYLQSRKELRLVAGDHPVCRVVLDAVARNNISKRMILAPPEAKKKIEELLLELFQLHQHTEANYDRPAERKYWAVVDRYNNNGGLRDFQNQMWAVAHDRMATDEIFRRAQILRAREDQIRAEEE